MHILLLIAFFKDPLKCFRNSGTYLVGNLAISDVIVCLLNIFRSVVETSNARPTSWSQYVDFVKYSFPGVSYASIAIISIDRFFMVLYPLQHRIWMKRKILAAWLASIWIVSFIYPTKMLAFGNSKHDLLVASTFGLVVTLCSAVMYALTYVTMRKRSRSIVLDELSGKNSRAQAARIIKEKRFLTTIIVIACINVVCNVPMLLFQQVVSVLQSLGDPLASKIVMNTIFSLFYINFSVNPFIYIARLPNYRKTFYLLYYKKMISCCNRRRKEAQQVVNLRHI